MAKVLIFIILLAVLPDLYIWTVHTRVSQAHWHIWLLIAPTIFVLFSIVMMLAGVRTMWFMQAAFIAIVCISVPKLAFTVFDLVAHLAGWGSAPVREWGMRIALLLAVLMAAVQIYSTTAGWTRLTVNAVKLTLPTLPRSFDGYRIVQLSDLHVGTYGSDSDFLSRVVDSVNAQQPDAILFTGDLVNSSSEELPPFIEALSRLRAKDGVFAILGNHDYCIYNPNASAAERKRFLSEVISTEHRMGWNLLLNEHCVLKRGTDSIYVAGVENVGRPPFPAVGDLRAALQGIPSSAFTILMSHDPWHWHHGVVGKTAIPLTLSGHTHAMQIQLGKFSPAQWMMKEWGGLYADGSQQLYVSIGVGGTIPYRLGAWPRIEVITLHRQE